MRVYKTLTRISVAFSLKLKHKIAHNSRSFGSFSTLIHSEPTPLSFPLTSTYSSPLFDLSHIPNPTWPYGLFPLRFAHPSTSVSYDLEAINCKLFCPSPTSPCSFLDSLICFFLLNSWHHTSYDMKAISSCIDLTTNEVSITAPGAQK